MDKFEERHNTGGKIEINLKIVVKTAGTNRQSFSNNDSTSEKRKE